MRDLAKMAYMKKQKNHFSQYFTQGGFSFDKNSTDQASQIHGILEADCHGSAAKWS